MDSGAAAAEESRPEKRQRLEEQRYDEPGGHAGAEADGPPGPPPAGQLKQALQKIANHIGNSAKFAKASQLLRQVMDAVDKSHRYVRSMPCTVACCSAYCFWDTVTMSSLDPGRVVTHSQVYASMYCHHGKSC